MPFVRIVERDPTLPHQMYLSISQDQKRYLISCQCMVRNEVLAELTFKEAERYSLLSHEILRRWKVAQHNPEVPALTALAVDAATRTRWVWVDLGPQPDAAGAEQP